LLPRAQAGLVAGFFFSYNYICHFAPSGAHSRKKWGGFRSSSMFRRITIFFLRMTEKTDRIQHVPRCFIIGEKRTTQWPTTFVANRCARAGREAIKVISSALGSERT